MSPPTRADSDIREGVLQSLVGENLSVAPDGLPHEAEPKAPMRIPNK